jgi:NADH-quinone oxidoreductase subunit M
VFATGALVLSAVYVLWLYQRMMTGPLASGNEKVRDLVPRELIVVAPLIALLIALGLFPKPALDVIDPAVGHTMTTIGQTDPAPTVPGPVLAGTAVGADPGADMPEQGGESE